MKNQALMNTMSTLQEWTNFLTVLNGAKGSNKPLLKKADCPSRLVYRLTKQFPK